MLKYWLLLWPVFYFDVPVKKENLGYKINGYAQGTSYSLHYFAQTDLVKKSSIDSIMQVIDQSMSLYQPNSLLSQFNGSLSGIRVDPHFVKVYQKAKLVNKDTKGAFDVTVASLVQTWGYGPAKVLQQPNEALIDSLLNFVGMEKLSLHQNNLRKTKPGVKIDFNGIAQGYTVDVVAEYLQSQGLHNFMFELGGEIRVKGQKPNGELFRIGVAGPLKNKYGKHEIKHIVAFKSGALTTSGNEEKKNHLINPKTGKPIETATLSVTVYAKDAITADGYDNALMAMSVKDALDFVKKRKNLEVYIVYQRQNGEIADTLSVGFKKMIVN